MIEKKGQHEIQIDHSTMGQTCGILPVGIDNAHVKTKGLQWDVGELILHPPLIPFFPPHSLSLFTKLLIETLNRLGYVSRRQLVHIKPSTPRRTSRMD